MMDRRNLLAGLAVLPLAGMTPAVAETSLHALHASMLSAVDVFNTADTRMERVWDVIIPAAQARGVSFDAHWEWVDYIGDHPAWVARKVALKAARLAVEAVFMATPRSEADDNLVMHALDLHEHDLMWSGYASTLSRWFFTPARFRKHDNAVYAREQAWALDPAQDYKLGTPYFLRRMRGEDFTEPNHGLA